MLGSGKRSGDKGNDDGCNGNNGKGNDGKGNDGKGNNGFGCSCGGKDQCKNCKSTHKVVICSADGFSSSDKAKKSSDSNSCF